MRKRMFLPVLILLALADAALGQGTNPLRINCTANLTNWVCGVASTATVFYPPPTTTAGCPTNAVVTCSPPSGALFPLGTTTVTCRATNSCRESAVCSFTVTVARDTTPPVIQCPTNRIVWLCGTATTTAVVSWPSPSATDNAAPSVAVTCSPTSGSTFPLGTTTVTCTATDNCTNRTTCTFTVTVARDMQPPTITCPPNTNVTACASTGAVVNYPTPTATDNADFNVAVTCSPPSGGLFPLGSTTVTCTATDDCTNRTTCTFLVRVTRDTTPPSITCPSNQVVLLCGTAATIPVDFPPPTVSDNLDPNVAVICVPASGSSFSVGTNTVVCTATDDCSNTRSCSFTVTVIRDATPPVMVCPTSRTILLCGSAATVPVNFPTPTAADNFDPNVTVTCTPASGSSFSVGTSIVTCTATDDCTNRSTCTFTITVVRDTTPPVITCPSNMVFNCLCPGPVFNVDFFQATAVDDHDPNPTIVCNPPSIVSSPGVHVITCIARDNCGNSNSCSFTVTFNYDTIPPVFTCPTNMNIWTCSNFARVNYSASATDTCTANVNLACTPPSGSLFPLGTTVVVCTATDNCTNRSSCTFTVTVNRDTTPPTIVCPTNVVASICSTCAVSQCAANVPQPIRPSSVGNGLFYGSSVEPDMTMVEAEQAILQREASGYHPIYVNAYQPIGQFGTASVKFAITWVRDDDSAFPHDAGLQTTAAQLQAAELAQHALRPISISGYRTSARETRFAVAYTYDDSGYPWRLILDRDDDQFNAESVALAQQGYRAISISSYSDGANSLNSAIFVQDGLGGFDWVGHLAIPDQSFQEWFDGWFNQSYAPVSLCAQYYSSPNGSATYFSGLMARVPTGGSYVAKHGLTKEEFLAENAHWTNPLVNEYGTTFRPVVVSAYQSWFHGGERRYVAAWRESAPRAFSATGVAQPSMAALDTMMEAFMRTNDINAATLCVSKDGGVVHHRGYTWAPYEFKQTQPCARFRIASASKAVTAVAVMKLLEGNYFVGMKNGQLQALTLDTPVFQINGMPNLPLAYGTAAQGITVRQLLQHRAGWNRAVYEPLYNDINVAEALSQPLPLTRKDMIDFMMSPGVWPAPNNPLSVGFQPLGPNDDSTYSNFGFSVLAELIAVISNQPYESFVRNNVLLPAGANRTLLGRTARLLAARGPDEVTYTAGVSTSPRWYVSDSIYNPLDVDNPTRASVVYPNEVEPPFPTSAYGANNIHTIDAAGGWVATSDDLVRLLNSFDAYDPADSETDTPLLEWESVREMWTEPGNIHNVTGVGTYSLGWIQTTLNTPAGAVRVHYHGGNIDGAFSIIARRSDGVCFAAMFSRDAGGGAFTALNSVINAITNWPVCQDGTVVNYPSPIATDNHDSSVSVVCSPPSGSYFPLGVHAVTCTATDDCGNRRACSFNVTVKVDNAPPSIQCPTNRVVWTCSTNGAVVHFPPPTVDDDADSNLAVVCTPPSGSLFPVGRTVVTCTATDDCGNRSSCTFTVTVNADTIPPVIHCPPDMVLRTCSTNAIARYTVTANDNRDSNVTLVCSPRSGSELPVGVTIVSCTARDGCGNERTSTFSITVNADTTAPTLTCPTNLVVHTLSPSGRAVCYPPPTVNEANAIVVCDPPSGSVFPIGTNRVTCTVIDACGNERTCQFTVEVRLQNLRVLHAATPQLAWEGDAVLESATEVTGPWLRTERAQSPYPVSPVEPRRFFRLAPGTGTNPGDCPCGQVGGVGGVWNFDVPRVRIQGAFRLNGQPFPASFLHGANFFLRNATTGDEVYLGLSNNDTFDRRVVPGKYDIIYEHKIGADVPLNSKALLQQIDLVTDQLLNIDVPAVRMTGAFTLNGAAPPASPGEAGKILVRDERNGAQTELGETRDQTYGALLIPGIYDVLYSYVAGSVVPFNRLGMLRPDVGIATAGVLNIDVPAVEVGGSFLYDGLPAPNSPAESGSVFLVDVVTQGEAFIGVTHGGDYLVNVIPGDYDVLFRRSASAAVAPANSNARFQRGVAFLQDTTFDVNIPTVTISGEFLVNGQMAPNSQTESARIWLRAGNDRCLLGRTDGGAYEIKIIPGDYDILFESVNSGAVMPANTNTVIGSRQILDNAIMDIDIPAVTYSANVLFNGATLLDPPGDDECRIYLEHVESAAPVLAGVFPEIGQLSRVVIPGVYRIRYEYRAGQRLPRNQFAAVGNEFPLFQSLETQIDVRYVPLSGDFLLNGTGFPPGPGNNAAILLRGTGPSSGDSVYLGPTSAGSYSTAIIPGQYQPIYNWVFGTEIPRNQQAEIECPQP